MGTPYTIGMTWRHLPCPPLPTSVYWHLSMSMPIFLVPGTRKQHSTNTKLSQLRLYLYFFCSTNYCVLFQFSFFSSLSDVAVVILGFLSARCRRLVMKKIVKGRKQHTPTSRPSFLPRGALLPAGSFNKFTSSGCYAASALYSPALGFFFNLLSYYYSFLSYARA